MDSNHHELIQNHLSYQRNGLRASAFRHGESLVTHQGDESIRRLTAARTNRYN